MIPRSALLYAVSFLILFLEFACIRWAAAYVPFVGFFGRHVLIAAILGTCLGCLGQARAAAPGRNVPLLLLQLAATLALVYALAGRGLLSVWVGGPERAGELFFGTEVPAGGLRLPVELAVGLLFVIVLAIFTGLGSRLAAAFGPGTARLADYARHLAGGLAGAAAFSLFSAAGTGPPLWLAVAAPLVLYVSPAHRGRGALALGLTLLLALRLASPGGDWVRLFSPYYRIDYDPAERVVRVDGIGHQRFLERREMERGGAQERIYALPHRLAAAAGRPPFARVLVIGAGGGNDVAAALDHGARHVGAVEIDPAIAALGRAHHPARPYDDPRVELEVTDGRAFLERAVEGEPYDLVVYALVDSLQSYSGYGSVRLENFLFTREALEAARDVLAPGGVLALYNDFRADWLVARIAQLAAEGFGDPPLVLSLEEGPRRRLGLVLAGGASGLVAPARAWAGEGASARLLPAGQYAGPLPTDDWPFLYLETRRVPAHNLRMLALLLVVAMLAAARYVPRGSRRLDAAFFLLGVGFMLLQTVGVARMALLFGTTWVSSAVTVVVLFASALAATAWVGLRPASRRAPWAAGLLASLAAAAWIPLDAFLRGSLALLCLGAALNLFVPAFCAGVLFARRFRTAESPQRALGSNLAGLVVGGVLESASLVIGLRGALGLAALAYALAAVADRRRAPWER